MTPAQSAVMEERELVAVALIAATRNHGLSDHDYYRAMAMLNAGAYLDAVLVMKPEGWALQLCDPPLYGIDRPQAELYPPGREWHDDRSLIKVARGDTRALAALAAIERSYEHA